MATATKDTPSGQKNAAEAGHQPSADEAAPEKKFNKKKLWIAAAWTVSLASLFITPLASVAFISAAGLAGIKLTVATYLPIILGAVTAGFFARNYISKRQNEKNTDHQDNVISQKIQGMYGKIMNSVMNHSHAPVQAAPAKAAVRAAVTSSREAELGALETLGAEQTAGALRVAQEMGAIGTFRLTGASHNIAAGAHAAVSSQTTKVPNQAKKPILFP